MASIKRSIPVTGDVRAGSPASPGRDLRARLLPGRARRENSHEQADELAIAAPHKAIANGDPDAVHCSAVDGAMPLPLASSDNGLQMRFNPPGSPRRDGDHAAVRPLAHLVGPGLDRDPVRLGQRRMARIWCRFAIPASSTSSRPRSGQDQLGQTLRRHRPC
jgi:hypothetical protein